MFFNAVFLRLTRLLVSIAIIATTYLYLYPAWFGCVFTSPGADLATSLGHTIAQHITTLNQSSDPSSRPAPFRLLVLADPQLEGDTSLPKREDAFVRKIGSHWRRIRETEPSQLYNVSSEILNEVLTINIPRSLEALRKTIDLFGNDFYLAHIYRTLHWWTKPTHVTVLGDLVGSQWVDEEEFEWRGWRYWNRVFAGGRRVEDSIMESYKEDDMSLTQMDDPAWSERIINIAGNHDIGYAGDISQKRMDRFERVFGKANWDLRFQYPQQYISNDSDHLSPTIHLIVLNSMLLDTPVMDEELQTQTYEYINTVITKRARPVEDRSSFTLLLTHVPLHKKEGVCVDAPFFGYFGNGNCGGQCKAHALKEQNHLSEHASQPGMLESFFGMNGRLDVPASGRGRHGLILTGHDHEGCDTWHYVPANTTLDSDQEQEKEEFQTTWDAVKWKDASLQNSHTGVREVTLRSMMGEYGGNAGLLSAWFDFAEKEWKYDIRMCKVGVQHIWWAIHILDLIALLCTVIHFTSGSIHKMFSGLHRSPKLRIKATKVD